MRILPNSKKFSAGQPLSSIKYFGHNGLYLQRLSFGSCGLPKIFGDWKFASNFGKVA